MPTPRPILSIAFLLLTAAAGCAGNSPGYLPSLGYRPSSEHHRMAGGRLLRQGDYAAAIAEYDRAIQLQRTNAHAYNDRGVARRSAGDFAGALADFNTGIRLRPSYGTLYFNRAQTNSFHIGPGSTPADLARVDVPGVLADYEKSVRLTPSNFEAHHGRFLIFLAQGDTDRAVTELSRWLKAAPRNHPHTPLWRGVRHLLHHRDAEAQAEFERFFRKHPESRIAGTADIEKIKQRRGPPKA